MPWRRVGKWRYSSIILDLDTRWRWVPSFTPRPLLPQGNRLWYQLDRRLGEPPSRPGSCGEEKNIFPDGNRTWAVQPVAIMTDRRSSFRKCLQSLVISRSLLDPNIFLSTLHSYTLSEWCPLKVRDQVLNPLIQKACKIIVPYALIFTSLDVG
jgi:hypothetical protein